MWRKLWLFRGKIWPSFEVKLSKPGCAQLKRIWKHTEIMMTCVVIIVKSVESFKILISGCAFNPKL